MAWCLVKHKDNFTFTVSCIRVYIVVKGSDHFHDCLMGM
jgi:hypothetical protein